MDENERDSVEAGLRAVFREGRLGRGGSALDAIEQRTGATSRVLLRDDADDRSPLLKVHAPGTDDALPDDRRYQVVGEIARGGVGVIYKGRDRDLGRDVALKVLRKELADSPEIVQRFVEEAQVEGQLQHPGIIPVHGLGLQPDGRPFFAMKLVKGQTLSAVLKERSDPADDRARLVAVFEKIAQTMAYAHARGVIHRDLKPSNVLLGSFGEVLVVDWGFAKVFGREEPSPADRPATTIIATVRTGEGSSHSLAGSVMGTPAYMPPEQALGQVDDMDERADVFALGAILCELLTGRPPYVGEPKDLLVLAAGAKLDDAWARLDACGAAEELTSLARRCLSPARGDRPVHAGAVADVVSGYLAAAEERARRSELAEVEARADAEEEQARLAQERLLAEREKARAVEEAAEANRQRQAEAAARRQALRDRRARRRTVGLAAAVLVAVLAGAGSWAWVARAETRRADRAERLVAEAMERASLHRGREDWEAAAIHAAQATDLAASEEVGQRLRSEAAALEAEIAAAKVAADAADERLERDRRLVEEMEELNLRQAEEFDARINDDNYAEAFRRWGQDLETADTDEAASAIRASSRPEEIAAHVDHWAALRILSEQLRDLSAASLLRIARSADVDPYRESTRTAASAKNLDALRGLAGDASIVEQPSRTLDLLATALMTLDDWEAAAALLRRAKVRHPGAFWIQYKLGFACLTTSPPDLEEAARAFVAARALRPGSAKVWCSLGNAHRGARRPEKALACIRRAIELDDAQPWIHNSLGLAFMDMGRYDDAEGAFRRSLALDGQAGLSLAYLGRVLQLKGRPREASPLLRRSIAALRREQIRGERNLSAVRWSALAGSLKCLGDSKGEVEARRQVCQLAANSVGPRLQLVRALLDAGETDEAVALARSGVMRWSHSAVAHDALGMALVEAGKPEEAVGCYERAIELEPDGVDLLGGVAVAHLGAGNDQEALSAILRAIELEPRCRWWGYLGVVRQRRREWKAAREAYGRAIECDLHVSWIHLNLSRLAWKRADPRDAIAQLERAIELDPEGWEARYNLGRSLVIVGRLDDAIHVLQEAHRRDPKNSGPLFELGRTQVLLGRYDAALQSLDRCLAIVDAPTRAAVESLRTYCEECRLAAADLPRILSGDRQPANREEADEFAGLCFRAGHLVQAYRLYLRSEPLNPTHGGFAAIAALAAGDGKQSHDWLLSHLDSLTSGLEDGTVKPFTVIRWLARWLHGPEFARVRGEAVLAQLPPEEAADWRALWRDIDALLDRVREGE